MGRSITRREQIWREGILLMTVSLIASVLPPTADTALSSTGQAASSTVNSDSSPLVVQPQELPPPSEVTTYPKSVIPQPFPPAFPEVHLPPADPLAGKDTVTISETAQKAAQASPEADQNGDSKLGAG
jgi:hypothetical protein